MIFRRKKTLPRAFASSRPAQNQPQPPAPPPPAPALDSTAARKKILVVDDDEIVLRALSLKLKSEGYRVTTAADGCQALHATRRERPDLMLLDVNFPRRDIDGVPWDGFAIAEWLRRRDEPRKLPVIVMSGSNRPEYHQRAAAAGASAFVPKSLNGAQLLASIEAALGAQAAG